MVPLLPNKGGEGGEEEDTAQERLGDRSTTIALRATTVTGSLRSWEMWEARREGATDGSAAQEALERRMEGRRALASRGVRPHSSQERGAGLFCFQTLCWSNASLL